ncbi:MAG: imidazole glycerol phosphate synthase subunit HisH [Anaerolineae bacterium]
MIAIVDYGVGNLRSVQKALERVGAEAVLAGAPGALQAARGVVLPGVGAFGDGMAQLRARGFLEPVLRQVEAEKPLLGICLGMQLLFEESEEMGQHAGLGLLPGKVVRFPEGDLKVPHIGWNQLHVRQDPLLAGIADGSYAYFVHSYYVAAAEPGDVLATTEYGMQFASVVGRGRIWGAQFHPEKSQEVGLRLLQNFARLAGAL